MELRRAVKHRSIRCWRVGNSGAFHLLTVVTQHCPGALWVLGLWGSEADIGPQRGQLYAVTLGDRGAL